LSISLFNIIDQALKVRFISRKRQRLHFYKILKHSLITRHKLLESAKDLQHGSVLPQQTVNHATPTAIKRKIDRASLEKRVKHRYHQELISIKKEVGDSSDSSFDDNYPGEFLQINIV
jgi:hypothetical protein